MTQAHERRAFDRYSNPVDVNCHWLDRHNGSTQGKAIDIGGGGIKVRLPHSASEATEAYLEIKSPHNALPVKAKAKLIWKDPKGKETQIVLDHVAFQFTEVNMARLGELFPSIQKKWDGGISQR